jgi:hypothetical protein
MSMTRSVYSVVAASPRHIKPMAAQLRAAACITLQDFGYEPRAALHRAFIASRYCRTALMDGKPVAMWGAKGTLLGEEALVWLVLSDEVTKMPVSVVKEARAELAVIMDDHKEVAITVLPNDEAAIRFAVAMGFHDRENDDGHLSRKEMVAAIVADPRMKIPIGDSFVIALGCHPSFGHGGQDA